MDRCDVHTYPELMTVNEVSHLTGKGKNWVYSAVRQNLLQSVRLGGSIRIIRKDLIEKLGL